MRVFKPSQRFSVKTNKSIFIAIEFRLAMTALPFASVSERVFKRNCSYKRVLPVCSFLCKSNSKRFSRGLLFRQRQWATRKKLTTMWESDCKCLNFHRRGVIRAQYLRYEIRVNQTNHCIQPTPLGNATWIDVCGQRDTACLRQ